MISRLLAIIKKELWLLSRSKVSTLGILLGPMIIILLIGLLFSNAGGALPTIGAVNEDFSSAPQYVDSLKQSFRVVEYDDADVCRVAVRSGTLSACVVFSGGEPPQAKILVDPSDVNSVYTVLSRISGNLDDRTSQVRESITERLLGTLATSSQTLAEEESILRLVADSIEQQRIQAGEVYAAGSRASISVEFVSEQSLESAISSSQRTVSDYEDLTNEILREYRSFVNRQSSEESPFSSEFDQIESFEDRLSDVDDAEEAQRVFAQLLDSISDLDAQISSSQASVSSMREKSGDIADSLADAQDDLELSIAELAALQLYLAGLDIGEQDITSPIVTQVEPVVADDDNLGFLLPYFITLLLMFTAILLSSSIIVRERESAAYFRNFITPTPEWLFVIGTFVTCVVVLLVQLFMVLGIIWPLFDFRLLARPFVALVLLFVVSAFFTLLGMLIGYVFRSREAALLGGMGVAATFLLFSGFVFPLSDVSSLALSLIEYNPFVLSADVIKAASLLALPFTELLPYVLALTMYCLMLYALIMIVQRVARIKAFEQSQTSEKVSAFLESQDVPEHRVLSIGQHHVTSKSSLVMALKNMTDAEYEKYVTPQSNAIAQWINDVYKDDKLALRLQNKSRLGAIAELEKSSSSR